jgi:sterol desaturase/sphingolipid hydroxylase (fatty acid hydroxylase superfamily)
MPGRWLYLIWPAILAAGLALFGAGLAFDLPVFPLVLAITVAAGSTLIGLQHVMPLRPEWNRRDDQRWPDIGHFIVGFALGSVVGAGLAILAGAPIARLTGGLWPTRLAMPLQVALAVVLAEFGNYWQHRLAHAVPYLWRFHALHHDPDRMAILKTTRVHAFDNGASVFCALLPIAVLGAPTVVILWLNLVGNLAVLLEHANVRMATPRWLNAIVCTPANHLRHHSRVLTESNSNFAMYVMVFDHLFGTFRQPAAVPPDVGIEDNPVPRRFVDQTVRVFWRRTNAQPR